MFPMDFKEFLWATGNATIQPLIERRFAERQPVGWPMHRRIMDLFRMEIDFLLAKSNTQRKRNVSPIEVKSGRKYSAVSLDKFRAKFAPFIDTPFVLHKKDVQVRDGVVFFPLYMAPFLPARR